MLDFEALKAKCVTVSELAAPLTRGDLAALTNEMIDTMRAHLQVCTDADVAFVPVDAGAYDADAGTAAEATIAWTLGHVIVHTTASAEEAAFLAAELARGVPFHGRSRAEVHWTTVTTIAQCRQRLDESRRMRLASLDLWPDAPDLDNTYRPWEGAEPRNCKERFVLGLRHDWDHLGQIAEIVQQSAGARLVPA